MKNKILALLKNADGYVSGEKISQKLGISRTAIWKHINNLRKEGYIIESVTNKGYSLKASPDIISEYEIKDGLCTKYCGQNVRYMYETDSTNNEARRCSDMSDGSLFIAEIQNGGKGRLGKGWASPPGSGVWMSLLLKPDILPTDAAQITLVAGLAVCKALKKYGAMVKWPNDIVIDGKKICGILTEMSAEIERVNYIICGIGINVNTEEFPEDIAYKATSVYMVTGEKHSRCDIVKSVMEEFEPLYESYLKNGLLPLLGEYKENCVNIGKKAEAVFNNDRVISGIAVDVREDGALVIETANGSESVSSGEVSVSGLYGHI